MFAKLKDFDFYRKIPKDLTEGSTHGSILSICAIIFMLTLFSLELIAFLTVSYNTSVAIDTTQDVNLRINFNITMLDLSCEYAVIDVVDILGSRIDNVTKNMNKWQIDSEGGRRNYVGRGRAQLDLEHDNHHDLENLHANGVHALPLDKTNFDDYLQKNRYVFVDFYAPWCSWCQRLEPVWEAFAEKVEEENLDVKVVKVDCEANPEVCAVQKIVAFPTMRLFRDNSAIIPDYKTDRTVESFVEYIKVRFINDRNVDALPDDERKERRELEQARQVEHPGCMLVGYLLVNRVPGNFHLEARSAHHNLNPLMANLSHVVNSLSFGPVLNKDQMSKISSIPSDYFSVSSLTPLNDRYYVTEKLHQAFHHYLKVVSTNIDFVSSRGSFSTYQVVKASQIMKYDETTVPEARFSFDLSPMAVTISKTQKRFYEFITSLCAVIGGTFTVVGILSGFLSAIFKSKQI